MFHGSNLGPGTPDRQRPLLSMIPPLLQRVSTADSVARAPGVAYVFPMFDFFRNRTDGDDREYQIVLEREDDGTFVATSPALPGYVAYGTSETTASRRLKRAIRRNLEGFAADHIDDSTEFPGRTSRHKSSLHFQLPLTLTAKIVLGSLVLAGAATLLSLEARRRRSH